MDKTHSLTARQIKAARSLVDWSQEDLAEATGLSVATIRNLELGHISPRGKTTQLLRECFENAGLEFVEPGGVRYQPENVTILEGMEGLKTFFDNVYYYARKNGQEDIISVCPSEVPYIEPYGSDSFIHIERMTKIKDTISVKCILTEDDKHIWCSSYSEYRLLSKQYFQSVPFYVYDDKYAFFDFEFAPTPRIVVIKSRSISEAFRKQFDCLWEKATPIIQQNNVKVNAPTDLRSRA